MLQEPDKGIYQTSNVIYVSRSILFARALLCSSGGEFEHSNFGALFDSVKLLGHSFKFPPLPPNFPLQLGSSILKFTDFGSEDVGMSLTYSIQKSRQISLADDFYATSLQKRRTPGGRVISLKV